MNIKAALICEDVRFEASGALTLVGVYNEQLVAPPGDGPIRLDRLAFLVVAAGLRGVERVGYRQFVRRAGAETQPTQELQSEPHHPESDEHNFVFGPSALTVAEPGEYELVVELHARDERLVHRYCFQLERATE